MIFFKSTNTHAMTMKIESQEMKYFTSLQEMKSLTKVIVIVHAFYVFRARLRRRPLPRARPTVGVARRTAPHRDAFETTIARMGIFDDVFGARATRGRNEDDERDERVVALRVLVQVSRGDRGERDARATTERDDDGARDDDDDDGEASTKERR